MLISRTGKRLMAFVMAFAFMLSGIAFFPKAVAAADDGQPVVTVLGATIRLGGKTDNQLDEATGKYTQSMKIGIQVSNASLAESCGITFTVNGKSITVGTSNFPSVTTGYAKDVVYDSDKENDYVIYSAVITGIPQENFGTEIKVQGKAVPIGGVEEDEKTSVEATKNVYGVVEAMQKQYPDIKLENGQLKDFLGRPLTADALNHGDGNGKLDAPNKYPEINLDLKNLKYENGSNVEADKFDSNGYATISGGSGVSINFTGEPLKAGSKLTVDIEADIPPAPSESPGDNYIRSWLTQAGIWNSSNTGDIYGLNFEYQGHKATVSDGHYIYSTSITDHPDNPNGYDITFRPNYGSSGLPTLTIKSIKVHIEDAEPPSEQLGSEPTPTPIKPTPGPESIELSKDMTTDSSTNNVYYYDDGSVGVELSYEYSGAGVGFYLNKDKQPIRWEDYAGIVLDIDSQDAYPYLYELRDVNGETISTTTRYLSFAKGHNMVSEAYANGEVTSDPAIIFIKYNTWYRDTDEPPIWVSDKINAILKINSIRLIKKETPEALKLSEEDAIVVDGKEDAAYSKVTAKPIASRVKQDRGGDSDTSATVKLAWDADNLYGLVNVKDSSVDASSNADYQNDGIEVFLDEDNCKKKRWNDGTENLNPDAFQYRYTGFKKDGSGNALDAKNALFAGGCTDARNKYSKLEIKYSFTEDGYAVEFKIPFVTEKTAGTKVGFDLIVQDCKDGNRDAELYFDKTVKAKEYWNNLNDTFDDLALVESYSS